MDEIEIPDNEIVQAKIGEVWKYGYYNDEHELKYEWPLSIYILMQQFNEVCDDYEFVLTGYVGSKISFQY